MKKIILFFLIISNFSYCQHTNPVALQMSSQLIEADEYIGQDSYGCQYFIKNNIFFKVDKEKSTTYKNLSFGKLSKVDIQNPLRIILFYENFNTIIALDNQLSEIQKINFSQTNQDIIASAVGISSQNNFWVFNNLKQQLMLYNYIKNTTQTIGQPFEKNIKNYSSDFNHFYWVDESNRFFSCDIYGKKEFLAQIPDFDMISIADNKTIVLKKNDILSFFDLEKNKTIIVDKIEKTYKSFYYKNENLAIFTSVGITHYKINLP